MASCTLLPSCLLPVAHTHTGSYYAVWTDIEQGQDGIAQVCAACHAVAKDDSTDAGVGVGVAWRTATPPATNIARHSARNSRAQPGWFLTLMG